MHFESLTAAAVAPASGRCEPQPFSTDAASIGAVDSTSNQDAFRMQGNIIGVADGIATAPGGDDASRITLEVALDVLVRAGTVDVGVARRAVQSAHRAVLANGAATARRGMGSTLTLMAFSAETVLITHVGDSRAYVVRRGELHRLTRDHQRRWRTPEGTQRRGVTASIGGASGVPVADIGTVRVCPGDRFVLCTDGAYLPLGDALLAGLVTPPSPLNGLGSRVVHAALSFGGTDDATCVAIDLRQARDAAASPINSLEG